MKKKVLIPIIIVIILLLAGIGYLALNLKKQTQENQDMRELAELDKKEMESEYQQFANQYSEMRTQINNDSLVMQLTREQERTEQLLAELREVKSTDAREITRLKKELETVRKVLRSYVYEIDSLNRLNQNLTAENTQLKDQYSAAQSEIEGLSSEKATLSEKVAIAAQLNATGISLTLNDKRKKTTKRLKKCNTMQLNFSIARNVTASNGIRTIYVRITSPTGTLLGNAGTFEYENKQLTCTMKKGVEYGGEETPVTMFWNVTTALTAGTYHVSIFADNEMIGSRSFTFE